MPLLIADGIDHSFWRFDANDADLTHAALLRAAAKFVEQEQVIADRILLDVDEDGDPVLYLYEKREGTDGEK